MKYRLTTCFRRSNQEPLSRNILQNEVGCHRSGQDNGRVALSPGCTRPIKRDSSVQSTCSAHCPRAGTYAIPRRLPANLGGGTHTHRLWNTSQIFNRWHDGCLCCLYNGTSGHRHYTSTGADADPHVWTQSAQSGSEADLFASRSAVTGSLGESDILQFAFGTQNDSIGASAPKDDTGLSRSFTKIRARSPSRRYRIRRIYTEGTEGQEAISMNKRNQSIEDVAPESEVQLMQARWMSLYSRKDELLLEFDLIRRDWPSVLEIWSRLENSGCTDDRLNEYLLFYTTQPIDSKLELALAATRYALTVEDSESIRRLIWKLTQCALKLRETTIGPEHTTSHLRTINNIQGLLSDLKQIKFTSQGVSLNTLQYLAITYLLSTDLEAYILAGFQIYAESYSQPCVDPDISKQTLLILLSKLASHPSSPLVSIALDEWRQLHGQVPTSMYSTIFEALYKARLIEESQRLFRFYLEHSSGNIDETLCSLHVGNLCRWRRPSEAAFVLKQLNRSCKYEPTLENHNALIAGFALVGNAAKAMNWLEQLRKSGLRANEQSYLPLMQLWSARGSLESFLMLRAAANLAGISSPAMRDALVECYIISNLLEEAQSLLERRHTATGQNLRRQWCRLLHAYAKRADLPKMREISNKMSELQIKKDGEFYAAFIVAASLLRLPDKAWSILDVKMRRHDIEPSAWHYCLVMNAFWRAQQPSRVLEIYQEMLRHGITPTSSINDVLIRASMSFKQLHRRDSGLSEEDHALLCEPRPNHDLSAPSGKTTSAYHVILSNMPPIRPSSPTSYAYLMYAYGKDRAYDMVLQSYEEFLQNQKLSDQADGSTFPPARMISALLVANMVARKTKEVDNFWRMLQSKYKERARQESIDVGRNGWVPQIRKYDLNQALHYYLDFLRIKKRFGDMVAAINRIRNDGYDLDHRNWNAYIQYLCRSKTSVYHMLAFQLSEEVLMPHWPEWDFLLAASNGFKRRLRGLGKAAVRQPSTRAPTYQTIVCLALAAAKLDLKEQANGLEAWTELRAGNSIKQTLQAVRSLPPRKDMAQWEARDSLPPAVRFHFFPLPEPRNDNPAPAIEEIRQAVN